MLKEKLMDVTIMTHILVTIVATTKYRHKALQTKTYFLLLQPTVRHIINHCEREGNKVIMFG